MPAKRRSGRGVSTARSDGVGGVWPLFAAFMAALQENAAPVRLDWFRQDVARFRVVMLYASQAERAAGLRQLAAAGFALSEAQGDG